MELAGSASAAVANAAAINPASAPPAANSRCGADVCFENDRSIVISLEKPLRNGRRRLLGR